MRIFNVVNIVFYILIILSLLFSHIKESKETKKLYGILSFSIISILTVFRYTPQYADYASYRKEYSRASVMSFSDIGKSKSPAMFFCSKILNKISDNPQTFFVFTGLFITIIIIRFMYKYSSNIYISIPAFWGMMYWSTSINIVRQYMAIALFLLAFDYLNKEKINKKEWIKIIILTIIALLFHTSAITILLGIIAIRLHISDAAQISSVLKAGILCVAISLGISIAYQSFYSRYDEVGSYGTEAASVFGLVIPLIIFVLAWSKRFDLIDKNYRNRFYINISMFSLFFSIISVSGMLITARIGAYFSIFSLVLIPEIMNTIFKKFYYKSRTSIFLIILIVYYGVLNYLGKVPLIYQMDYWIFGGIVQL